MINDHLTTFDTLLSSKDLAKALTLYPSNPLVSVTNTLIEFNELSATLLESIDSQFKSAYPRAISNRYEKTDPKLKSSYDEIFAAEQSIKTFKDIKSLAKEIKSYYSSAHKIEKRKDLADIVSKTITKHPELLEQHPDIIAKNEEYISTLKEYEAKKTALQTILATLNRSLDERKPGDDSLVNADDPLATQTVDQQQSAVKALEQKLESIKSDLITFDRENNHIVSIRDSYHNKKYQEYLKLTPLLICIKEPENEDADKLTFLARAATDEQYNAMIFAATSNLTRRADYDGLLIGACKGNNIKLIESLVKKRLCCAKKAVAYYRKYSAAQSDIIPSILILKQLKREVYEAIEELLRLPQAMLLSQPQYTPAYLKLAHLDKAGVVLDEQWQRAMTEESRLDEYFIKIAKLAKAGATIKSSTSKKHSKQHGTDASLTYDDCGQSNQSALALTINAIKHLEKSCKSLFLTTADSDQQKQYERALTVSKNNYIDEAFLMHAKAVHEYNLATHPDALPNHQDVIALLSADESIDTLSAEAIASTALTKEQLSQLKTLHTKAKQTIQYTFEPRHHIKYCLPFRLAEYAISGRIHITLVLNLVKHVLEPSYIPAILDPTDVSAIDELMTSTLAIIKDEVKGDQPANPLYPKYEGIQRLTQIDQTSIAMLANIATRGLKTVAPTRTTAAIEYFDPTSEPPPVLAATATLHQEEDDDVGATVTVVAGTGAASAQAVESPQRLATAEDASIKLANTITTTIALYQQGARPLSAAEPVAEPDDLIEIFRDQHKPQLRQLHTDVINHFSDNDSMQTWITDDPESTALCQLALHLDNIDFTGRDDFYKAFEHDYELLQDIWHKIKSPSPRSSGCLEAGLFSCATANSADEWNSDADNADATDDEGSALLAAENDQAKRAPAIAGGDHLIDTLNRSLLSTLA